MAGLWPHPRSPWPGWADGGATVRVNVTRSTHWNAPTNLVLQPNESVTYGVALSACLGGPRTRDAALAAAGEPVLRGVPGYTIATDMATPALYVTLPPSVAVTRAQASCNATLSVGDIELLPQAHSNGVMDGAGGTAGAQTWRIGVRGTARGRSRLEVSLSDGTTAVAHYLVLPPLPTQVARVAEHWSTVAWLPRDYPDPFGRGASVMPCETPPPPNLSPSPTPSQSDLVASPIASHPISSLSYRTPFERTHLPSHPISSYLILSPRWDREDKRHRFDDGRAYDVGLSDDAGAANNLGLATSQAYAPSAKSAATLDEYAHASTAPRHLVASRDIS
jgi:hypothetical protein